MRGGFILLALILAVAVVFIGLYAIKQREVRKRLEADDPILQLPGMTRKQRRQRIAELLEREQHLYELKRQADLATQIHNETRGNQFNETQ